MSFLWRCRHSITRASKPIIPRGTRGVTGQFDHLPLPLPYNIKDGLGNFLPPAALEAVAMEYQLGLLARLTEEVRQTDDEGESVAQVIMNTAPFRDKTLAFNYASLALNNSFFLGHLTPNVEDSQDDAISRELLTSIRTEHGGLEQLKSSVSAAAMGMFTSGCVWFVCDRNGNTGILPTLGPGTLLVRSRTYMAQLHPAGLYHKLPLSPFAWDRDMEYIAKYMEDAWKPEGEKLPELSPKSISKMLGSANDTPLHARSMHTSARRSVESKYDARPDGFYTTRSAAPKTKTDTLNAGEVLYPLFCISLQEHAWITAGFGVWGKEAWLREFWNVLNWRQVSEAYEKIRLSSRS
ncbi:manganese superoxide dismutase [Mycena crocata]|nr:manganese superoxide dismutase [Mycena crocata]